MLGIDDSRCDLLGIKLKGEYLRLSGDYGVSDDQLEDINGENNCALLEN